MAESIYTKVIQALKQAEHHNGNVMVKPEVILWPDPEAQWMEVMGMLQQAMPQLFIYGPYQPHKNQGPSIWLKCKVNRTLSDTTWPADAIPVIYLPGVSKADLRNVENAVFDVQPLLEYQYTGVLFLQENGREWTVMAFLENSSYGLGKTVAKDQSTKDALRKALPLLFQDPDIFTQRQQIDADFLNNLLFPNIKDAILKWMCLGDAYTKSMSDGIREAFGNICKSQYEFEPDPSNIKAIAAKLGAQKNNWAEVWQLFVLAPHKYPQLEELLRMAKPADLGTGIFALPTESWPQINEEQEAALAAALDAACNLQAHELPALLQKLESEHGKRRIWVWQTLRKTPLADALVHLAALASLCTRAFPFNNLEALAAYYVQEGYLADQYMREVYAAVKQERDKALMKKLIQLVYKPWLEKLSLKFQDLVQSDASLFTSQQAKEETESFVLFVDAFRYELAKSFEQAVEHRQWSFRMESSWAAIPTVTPTAKPHVSPVAVSVSQQSEINEFRPQLKSGQDLQTAAFRSELQARSYTALLKGIEILPGVKYWQEIGDIDTKGHTDQADMVRRIDDLFDQIEEAIEIAFNQGVKRVKIVTDHGWLLLPGGLPKEQLHAGLTESRWGRCALMKEGVNTNLLHLPWRWNPNTYIAYAPGISFFKANVEYAHGGISLQECLVPTLIIENPNSTDIDAQITEVKWVNMRCTVHTTDIPAGYRIDIRKRYADAKSSVVLSGDTAIHQNTVNVLVDGDSEGEAVTIVLLDPQNRIIDRKPSAVGG